MAGVALAGVLALIVFVIGEPYAVIDWESFIKRVVEESNMVRGIADLPYTRQYIGTPAYLYQIWNTTVWGMGIPLGIVAFGGLAVGVGPRAGPAAQRGPAAALLGAGVLPDHRQLHGEVPAIHAAAGALPVPFRRGGRGQPEGLAGAARLAWHRAVLPATAVLVVLPTIFYAVAFVNIYAQTHPWIQVSEWIYRNLPANSVLATEHWDDRLPLGMTIDRNWRTAESFGHRDMANYEEDNAVKLNWMVENIRASSVIVLATNRLYGSIASLPDRYPLTTAYYQLLFGEKLGFKLVDFAATYPSLAGVTLVDDTFSGPRLARAAAAGGATSRRPWC